MSSYRLRSTVLGFVLLIVAANQLQLVASILADFSSPLDKDNLIKPSDAVTCNARQVGKDRNKIVCICTENDCPPFKFDWPEQKGKGLVVTSSRSGHRFKAEDLEAKLNARAGDKDASDSISIDLNAKFQTILGWGGAFTDAATMNIASLPKTLANELIESYFGADGLQYNFGRVPLGGSDFSTRAYSYDDAPAEDLDLKEWKLQHEDIKFKIPCIKQAREAAERAGNKLNLIASPWSPPKWMKDNNNFVRGHLKDEDAIYKSYANYLVNFYDSYGKNGVDFWGATVQNEPMAAFLPVYFFNSLQMGNEQMINFIANYLGPTLHARGYTKDKFKLMVGDDSLGFVNHQVPDVMNHTEVQKYVSGLAFHWYTSGSIVSYDALTSLVEQIKDKIEFVVMSEACTGSQPMDKKVDLGSWDRGEAYAVDIIEDFNRQTGAWVDWNLALDLQGGPNWSKNFVDSPILVNAHAREFYKQPMYYALGHFSRFFRPGFVRVGSTVKGLKYSMRSKVMSVAAVDEKAGRLVMTLLNRSNVGRQVEISVNGTDRFELRLTLERRSITSVVIKL